MAKPRQLNKREHRAWSSLVVLQADLSEYLERHLRDRTALSGPDHQVLGHLAQASDGWLRQVELGRLLRWEKARLSQHLTRMQSRGLVRREPSRSDRRGAVVFITPKGTDLVDEAAPLHLAAVRAVLMDHLTAEQLDLLAEIGDTVRERLAVLETQPPSCSDRTTF